MKYIFNEVVNEDWDILLEWRNDEYTRKMSHNNKEIKRKEHYGFMKKLNINPNRKQYIFSHDKNKIGTIREDILEDDIKELSYSINPKYRGNGYGKLMMFLFLFDKKGKFQCEVKTTNIGSVKMCEWSGFNLIKTINEVNIYQLIK